MQHYCHFIIVRPIQLKFKGHLYLKTRCANNKLKMFWHYFINKYNMTSSHYILPQNYDPVLKSSVVNSVAWHLNPVHWYNFLFYHGNIGMRFNRYIFVSLLPCRCVLFNNSCHNNPVCSIRTPYFWNKIAFIQSCITSQQSQLLKKNYFGELWPRSCLFGGIHFQFSIVNLIFHHFCTTLCHMIVILTCV